MTSYRTRYVCLVAFLASATLVSPGWGEPLPPKSIAHRGTASSDEAAKPKLYSLIQVTPGSEVRVAHRTLGLLQGTFASVSRDSLVLGVKEGETRGMQTLSLSDVESVSVRRKHGTAGLAFGAVIGAVVLATVAYSADDDDDIVHTRGLSAVLGALIGGAIGAPSDTSSAVTCTPMTRSTRNGAL